MSVVKLGDVARESRLKWEESKLDVPVVGLEHLIPDEIRFDAFDTNTDNTFSKKFVKGQVLFGRRRAYQRKAAVAEFDGICSGDITVIEAIEGKMMSELLPFIIQAPAFFDYANRGSAGSLSPRVKWGHLASYEFELPPLEEQKVLADKLWAAYRLKEGYKKLLAATDEMVKSQFIEMFGNTTQFGFKKVNDLFSLSMGKTPSRAKSSYWDQDGYEWASISDMGIWYKYVGKTAEHISKEAVFSTGIKLVPKNTIIMSFKLSIGRTCITTSDLYTNEAIMAFHPLTNAYNLDYLHFYIANYNWNNGVKQAVKGVTLNKESIGNSIFILPPKDLQEDFASIVRQADKSKFELKRCIDNIDKVIKSLING